ncbi:putative Membrane protein, partial [Pseudomonas syringae pv. atrofaciens]
MQAPRRVVTLRVFLYEQNRVTPPMLDVNRYVTPVLNLMQRYPGLIAAFGFVS